MLNENGTPNLFSSCLFLSLLVRNDLFNRASAPGGGILGKFLDLS